MNEILLSPFNNKHHISQLTLSIPYNASKSTLISLLCGVDRDWVVVLRSTEDMESLAEDSVLSSTELSLLSFPVLVPPDLSGVIS